MLNDIINRPEFVAMTDADLAAHLAESVETIGDASLWDYARVADTYGEAAAEGLAQAMSAAGLTTAVLAFASRGFNLSLDKVQAQLTAIASAVPELAAVCGALKATGRTSQSRWASMGGNGNPPDESTVNTERAKFAVEEWWTHVRDDVVPPMLTAAKTIAEIKAAIEIT